ncbi:Hydrogenase maturation factor HoxX [Trichoplax sp. H2]|uniref:Formyl transferase C-terminal domain-containing protein n=1 Tax=Trichoplax adhaerens TaxID=10228 RepID=B3RVH7_TRIAD|nr:hypothetical protein TRIADDRAFT_55657 [Trichoplax adhaerens]EDV25997.1 hypothetical protein TRIADDRAFT_55657 [Trichoplax adhaerens]RDD47052.1 Hydrogenase maturation factor HoxX [Trichoplax sp. H2]|eukprot:XP_002112030.1 hypothetical protein TRIADDRAFT_55657 [Trichoplax adhaerens]
MLKSQLHQLCKRQFSSTTSLLRRVIHHQAAAPIHQLAVTARKTAESAVIGEEVHDRYNILFFCNSNNSLTQRAYLELTTRGHRVEIVENPSPDTMIECAERENPDIIICPFLTKRIPPQLYDEPSARSTPCWIVHPGIVGDRGIHSIDWALHDQLPEWGVTVLQAADEIDAGDVSSTATFPIKRQATKSSLYQNEIVQAAVRALLQAVDQFRLEIPPRPLDYDQPDVKGSFRAKMAWNDRLVDWKTMSAHKIANTVRMSDSQPGAIMYTENTAHGANIRRLIFGAHVEKSPELINKRTDAKPGDIIAKRSGAVLFKTVDNQGVWISHMKASHGRQFIKLPSTSVLSQCELEGVEEVAPKMEYYSYGYRPETFQEIWINRQGNIAYIHFEFYNGAMSTEQCLRLRQAIHRCSQDQLINTIVLCGGYNFFSNGINLNTIEASKDPALESWRNINAIDDVVKEIFSIRDKVVISAMQGNAGAGGVMMALAADLVWSHDAVILNPHYKSMGLFGSEYYTYFLPKRVGQERARQITNNVVPMLARQAVKIGMFDKLIAKDHDHFDQMLSVEANKLTQDDEQVQSILDKKRKLMTDDWFQLLHDHRNYELDQMQQCFQTEEYIQARQKFVYH